MHGTGSGGDPSASSSVGTLSDHARATWVAGNRADAERLKACYALFRECVSEDESGAGAECAPGYAVVDPFEVCSNHLVAVFAISSGRADRMINLAVELTQRYPAVLQALWQGRLDLQAAQLLARQMRTVDDAVVGRVQQEVVDNYLAALEAGERLGAKAVSDRIDETIRRYDADGIRRRREEASRDRGVGISKGLDGMSTVWATLANDEAAVLAEKLDQRAAQFAAEFAATQAATRAAAAGETGEAGEAGESGAAGSGGPGDAEDDADCSPGMARYSLAEQRADALMALVCGEPDQADGTAGSPLRPRVTVIAAPPGPAAGTATNAGADATAGAAATRAAAADPGTGTAPSAGAEPVVQFPRTGESSIRALLAMLATSGGASLERIDPTVGAADDPARQLRYRPPAGLARTIRLRDGTCRHPGCTVAAEYCDLDHVCPFDHGDPARGGRTCEGNLMCLCRKHHLFKTFSNWRYTLHPDATLVVDAPDGKSMRTTPSGPLAAYRREVEQVERDTWDRQAERMPATRPDADPPAEPTFWHRHAARNRAERRKVRHDREHGATRPPRYSRRIHLTGAANTTGDPGERAEAPVSRAEQQLHDLLDEPPF